MTFQENRVIVPIVKASKISSKEFHSTYLGNNW